MFTGNGNGISGWLDTKGTYCKKKKYNPLGNGTPWWRTKVDMRKAVETKALTRERRWNVVGKVVRGCAVEEG